MKKVVFDIETRNTFEEVGSNNPADLDISVVVAYDYSSGKYYDFEKNELDKLWPIFEAADLLIGYNSDHFDVPILNKYYSGDLNKKPSLDILAEIKNSFGRRVSLNSVAAATLGRQKSGQGLEAVVWWKRGEIEKIKKYCRDDVKLTKEIYDFALGNGYLKTVYKGREQKILLPVERWEVSGPKPENHTLF